MYSEEFELGKMNGYKNGYIDGQQFAMNEIIRLNNIILSLKPLKIPVKSGVKLSGLCLEDWVSECDNKGNVIFRPTASDIHEIDEWITHIED